MDEARVPTAAPRPAPRWRSRWVLPGIPVAVLAILTINVLASGPLVRVDQRIHSAVLARTALSGWHWLTATSLSPAAVIIDLADPHTAVPVLAAIALVISARRRSLRPLLTAAIAVVLLVATVIPAKIVIGRLAPGRLRLQPGGWGAFPSGHTTTATVCYVLVALLAAPLLPAAVRRAGLVALPVWCLIVGIALVWANYHWMTDVIAGWALAALVLQATLWLAGLAGRLPGAGTGRRNSGAGQDAVPDGRPSARTPG
jgi:membrane-associated phospholipid phosphatase